MSAASRIAALIMSAFFHSFLSGDATQRSIADGAATYRMVRLNMTILAALKLAALVAALSLPSPPLQE
jgi:hypothetical protein